MANNKFREVAQKELSMSALMAGREQLKTDDIIGQDLTIVAFDMAAITDKGEEKIFPVIIFAEYPDHYYNGGTLLKKMCDVWAAMYDGDLETASRELQASGGVKVRFKSGRTKSGNNLTTIDVL